MGKVSFVCDVVRFPEDVEDESTTFHPEFSHQLYGDEYVNLPFHIIHSYAFITIFNVFID